MSTFQCLFQGVVAGVFLIVGRPKSQCGTLLRKPPIRRGCTKGHGGDVRVFFNGGGCGCGSGGPEHQNDQNREEHGRLRVILYTS